MVWSYVASRHFSYTYSYTYRSLRRATSVIGMAPDVDPSTWDHSEIEKYGLGKGMVCIMYSVWRMVYGMWCLVYSGRRLASGNVVCMCDMISRCRV